jgi:hypothetical protein
VSKRQPLFLDASFDKNTETYIKYNREPKLQDISVTDLAKEISSLKIEMASLRRDFNILQQEVEIGYPIDSWARQEINLLKERIESIPPPLEDVPFGETYFDTVIQERSTSELQGIKGMQVLPVSYQKYYVQIKVEICNEVFLLTALIDTGSDINMFHTGKIPAKYWTPSFGAATGLGNKDTSFKYEISRANILINEYSLGMRFHISDLPIDCILGTPFLSAVFPHGSCLTNGISGYFITMPSIHGLPCKRIELPFVSEEHMHIAFYQCMVIIEVFDKEQQKPVSTHFDDNTPWEVFRAHWKPTWQLRHSETLEIGLPGFSSNTSPIVLPPQHILGQIHQPITITSREKLIEFRDLTRLRSADTQWYNHETRGWSRAPVYHSFQINRMRALIDWPQQDPAELLNGINYDQYKATWFNAFLWTSRFNFFYCQIKFAHMFQRLGRTRLDAWIGGTLLV